MRFTEQMTMHLNGGSNFSELHYRIYGDGRPLDILHHRCTGGSPKYLIMDDVFVCRVCKSEFDCIAMGRNGLMGWLLEHAAHAIGPDDPVAADEPRATADED